MRKLLLGAGIILTAFIGGGANAMPIMQPSAPVSSVVQKVDYACGRGYYLTPRGYCRPYEPRRYEREWDRRSDWNPRREWREHQARREWREHRRWEERGDWRREREYRRWQW